MVSLLTTMISTVQSFSAYEIAYMPTVHVYKISANAVNGGFLLALAGRDRKIS